MTRKALTSLPGSRMVTDFPGLGISNHSRSWKVKKVAGCELQPSPDSSLDSFNHKSAKVVFKGDRYHPLQFRDFVSERVNASVRVRGIGPDGAAYRAVIPCNYRWSPHVRQRDLAVIYSWVDYVTECGYDPSEVAFF